MGGLDYHVGRRGSLGYLDSGLRDEVVSEPWSTLGSSEMQPITCNTLRAKAEIDTEVAPSVFVIGSLTGDSLIRYAYGSCIQTASHIIQRSHQLVDRPRDILAQACMNRADYVQGNPSDDGITIES